MTRERLSSESDELAPGSILVPFSWQQVSLHAAGAAVFTTQDPVTEMFRAREFMQGLEVPHTHSHTHP